MTAYSDSSVLSSKMPRRGIASGNEIFLKLWGRRGAGAAKTLRVAFVRQCCSRPRRQNPDGLQVKRPEWMTVGMTLRELHLYNRTTCVSSLWAVATKIALYGASRRSVAYEIPGVV
jgi:hypothetical protein